MTVDFDLFCSGFADNFDNRDNFCWNSIFFSFINCSVAYATLLHTNCHRAIITIKHPQSFKQIFLILKNFFNHCNQTSISSIITRIKHPKSLTNSSKSSSVITIKYPKRSSIITLRQHQSSKTSPIVTIKLPQRSQSNILSHHNQTY